MRDNICIPPISKLCSIHNIACSITELLPDRAPGWIQYSGLMFSYSYLKLHRLSGILRQTTRSVLKAQQRTSQILHHEHSVHLGA